MKSKQNVGRILLIIGAIVSLIAAILFFVADGTFSIVGGVFSILGFVGSIISIIFTVIKLRNVPSKANYILNGIDSFLLFMGVIFGIVTLASGANFSHAYSWCALFALLFSLFSSIAFLIAAIFKVRFVVYKQTTNKPSQSK